MAPKVACWFGQKRNLFFSEITIEENKKIHSHALSWFPDPSLVHLWIVVLSQLVLVLSWNGMSHNEYNIWKTLGVILFWSYCFTHSKVNEQLFANTCNQHPVQEGVGNYQLHIVATANWESVCQVPYYYEWKLSFWKKAWSYFGGKVIR